MTWYDYFLQLADTISLKSKDRSVKVGAVIVGEDNEVLSIGFNGFPRGVHERGEENNWRFERPHKYSWTEHAERNAIFNAARQGIALRGGTLFLNYEPFPCSECARGVIQSGIVRVVGWSRPFTGSGDTTARKDWRSDFEITKQMFREAGVETIAVEQKE